MIFCNSLSNNSSLLLQQCKLIIKNYVHTTYLFEGMTVTIYERGIFYFEKAVQSSCVENMCHWRRARFTIHHNLLQQPLSLLEKTHANTGK